MSKKSLVYQTVKDTFDNTYYGYTNTNTYPRVIISLVSNVGMRLSNKRHSQDTTYQVSFFDEDSHDVEASQHLLDIQNALEDKGLITTEWMEIPEIDEDTASATWHYMIEVS